MDLTWLLQKLGRFDNAIRISPEDRDGGVGTLPIPETGIEDLNHHLAPCVFHTTAIRHTSDFILWKGNQGGAATRLFFGPMVAWYLDPLDARSHRGTFSPRSSSPQAELT